MATVTVTVGGRSHTIGCGDGEEARVAELAAEIDRRATMLAQAGAQTSYGRLMMMTALLIADELDTATRALEQARKATATPAPAAEPAEDPRVSGLADRLEDLLQRLDDDAPAT